MKQELCSQLRLNVHLNAVCFCLAMPAAQSSSSTALLTELPEDDGHAAATDCSHVMALGVRWKLSTLLVDYVC